jgi:hypothetical protein
MPRLPSRAEITSVLETELQNQTDATGAAPPNLRAASRNSVYVSTVTLGLMRLQMYVADRVGARLLSEAQGPDLDDLGRDLFGEERKEAAKATGYARFIIDDAGHASQPVPRGTRVGVKATPNQAAVTFEVARDTYWQPGSETNGAIVPIVAQQEGSQANVDGELITDLLDPVPYWLLDTSLAYQQVVGGGADRETDDEYRRRLGQRSLDDDRQRGTRRAIEAGVGRVLGVYDWTVIEPGDGSIIVYAGDTNYTLTQQMISDITTELENWRPLGPALYLRPYHAIDVGVVLELYMQRDLKYYNQADIQTAAAAAVRTYFATGRATPDEYFVDAIAGSVYRTNRELQHVAVTLPTTDVRRPLSASYGAVQALNRYRVTSIVVNVHPPLTQ